MPKASDGTEYTDAEIADARNNQPRNMKAYTNQEKIKEALGLIDDFENSGVYVSDSHDNARRAKRILEKIKEILEK